ncbi:hypothetical protein C8J56DRAFT_883276 [Mycena floridula]|nr:hypothetical protein C8J56DRAFT_883276 [Mycena floridula]
MSLCTTFPSHFFWTFFLLEVLNVGSLMVTGWIIGFGGFLPLQISGCVVSWPAGAINRRSGSRAASTILLDSGDSAKSADSRIKESIDFDQRKRTIIFTLNRAQLSRYPMSRERSDYGFLARPRLEDVLIFMVMLRKQAPDEVHPARSHAGIGCQGLAVWKMPKPEETAQDIQETFAVKDALDANDAASASETVEEKFKPDVEKIRATGAEHRAREDSNSETPILIELRGEDLNIKQEDPNIKQARKKYCTTEDKMNPETAESGGVELERAADLGHGVDWPERQRLMTWSRFTRGLKRRDFLRPLAGTEKLFERWEGEIIRVLKRRDSWMLDVGLDEASTVELNPA